MCTFICTEVHTDILRHEQTFTQVFIIYTPVGLQTKACSHNYSQCADVGLYRSKLYAHNINAK